MKRYLFALSGLLLLAATPAMAQRPATVHPEITSNPSPGEVTPTPEMWFYEQYRQEQQDPKVAVRKKAEFRTAQRERRIAAMKWFGFSNMRPRASADPLHGDYAPGWTSNNGYFPMQWSGVGRPSVIVWRNGSVMRSY